MHLTKATALFFVALEKRIMSSTYITWVMGSARALTLTPSMFLRTNSFFRSLERISCPLMKRYDDRGSPCLSPLLGLNWSDLLPLTSTLKDIEETHAIIHPMKVSSKPSLLRTTWRKSQFTRSYAFWRSIFYGHLPCFNFPKLKTVNQLLNDDLIFSYPATKDKCWLAGGDEFGEERPDSRH